MPCEGGEAVMLTSETRLNNIGPSVSTADLKNLCHVGKHAETPINTGVFAVFWRALGLPFAILFTATSWHRQKSFSEFWARGPRNRAFGEQGEPGSSIRTVRAAFHAGPAADWATDTAAFHAHVHRPPKPMALTPEISVALTRIRRFAGLGPLA